MRSISVASGLVNARADLRSEYGSAVEAARSMRVDEIEAIIETPQDALSAIVLLDQMPRNIFRGPETGQVCCRWLC